MQTSAALMLMRIRRQKISEKRAPWDFAWTSARGDDVFSSVERGPVKFWLRPALVSKVMHNLSTFKVTGRSDYQGAYPFCDITLNAIYSYSYRADSAMGSFTLLHCAEPRKSPTIGQLQEMWPFGVMIWPDSCILVIRPIDGVGKYWTG
jgi:hypothetical protein